VLVARRDQLKEEICRFLLEGDVAHFVNNEQRVAAQPAEFVTLNRSRWRAEKALLTSQEVDR